MDRDMLTDLTHRLNDRLESLDFDEITDRLTHRLDALDATVRERMPRDLRSLTQPQPEPSSGPSRLLWAAIGFAAGMGVAYLADPDRGQGRRQDLQQRLTSTTSEFADAAKQRTDYVAGQAKGAAVRTAKHATPEDVPEDPKKLESRIRSEVFGRRDDVDKVVLRIDGPGTVAVKGTVASPVTERELLAEISDVEGVVDVSSELQVSGS